MDVTTEIQTYITQTNIHYIILKSFKCQTSKIINDTKKIIIKLLQEENDARVNIRLNIKI